MVDSITFLKDLRIKIGIIFILLLPNKPKHMKKLWHIIIIVCSLIATSVSLRAQIRDFGNFVTTGAEDAEELFKAYITPYVNGFGTSLTGGWYNTAKPHNLGGFDITLTVNAAIVPVDQRSFIVDDVSLNYLERVSGTEETSPTIAGEQESGPDMQYNYENYSAPAFSLPAGTDIPYVPSPMIQAGIGLIKGTDIIGRFLPKVGNDKGKFGLWGVGLKHDIKQWIPGLNKVPVLNISVMGGYTKMNSFIELTVDPGRLNLEAYYEGPAVWDDQQMLTTVSSFTSNILVSADLPVVTFYGGVGFAVTKCNLMLEGNYPMISDVTLDGPVVTAELDPIDIEIKNQDGGVTKPRLNAGIRLKLAVITIHLDYVWANYSMASFGLGLNIR